jgi:CBS domain-containing protein
MTSPTTASAEQLKDRTRFLARAEPFKGLARAELERVARALVERSVAAGEAVLVESGVPGTELFVVREGTLEMLHKEAFVTLITAGEVFGHPTLLTGLPPEFTTRARERSTCSAGPKACSGWRATSASV